ncbi:MAG: metal ABC transporter substrate-binding protein [Chloroflexi bacterium]|nr:metal ABC transporter substrate-binding protein [Chloroflexota bacterium]
MGIAAFLIGILVAACVGSPATSSSPTTTPDAGLLRIATTVSPITSIVENIGGTRIVVQGIVPEGINSHTFEPAPSVARILSNADLIVLNGLFLEEPTRRMAEANLKSGGVILLLGDTAITPGQWKFDFSFPQSQGNPNPHLWPDPILGLKYAELVRDELSRLDPDNADYYAANYEVFKARIEDFDRRIQSVIATVPEPNRRLLTYHDSWAYFAERYGMEVIGAVQPSDFTEPSARDVANLIDQVRDLGVPAIFGSEVFPSEVMEQIAKEGGAKFIDELRDDDLPGKPGDSRHSYLGLLVANMEVMMSALGGDPSALAGFDTGPVFQGQSTATYPQ